MWEEFFSITQVVPSKSYLEWGPWFTVILWLFVFGGCVGSFLNVVMLRGAKGDDYIFAPSRCPICQHKIRFWHNLPLLGYLLLRWTLLRLQNTDTDSLLPMGSCIRLPCLLQLELQHLGYSLIQRE